MMDRQTKSIVQSRDVLWLNRMYFPAHGTPGASVTVAGIRLGSAKPADDGSAKPAEDGSVDSLESISSAGKRKSKKSD